MTEKLAIIGGAGELGFGLALRWAAAGQEVILGSRDLAKAEQAAGKIRTRLPSAQAAGALNPDAAANASIVVLTVPFSAQAATLKSLKPALKKDAILVDASVPLAAVIGGRATRMLSVWEGSAAQAAQALLPEIAVVSAFHNVSAEMLQDLSAGLDCDVLVSGDDATAKGRLAALIAMIKDLRPLDAGPLEMSRVVESITALLISLNRRYKTHHAGIRITGLP